MGFGSNHFKSESSSIIYKFDLDGFNLFNCLILDQTPNVEFDTLAKGQCDEK